MLERKLCEFTIILISFCILFFSSQSSFWIQKLITFFTLFSPFKILYKSDGSCLQFFGVGGADHILGISYHTLAFSVIFLGRLTKEDSEYIYIYEEDITFGPMITTSSTLSYEFSLCLTVHTILKVNLEIAFFIIFNFQYLYRYRIRI